MMNGHLQLSISLKNHDEIEAAIELLKSLLPGAMPQKDFDEYRNEHLASEAATASKLGIISPSHFGKLGMKEMMKGSKKKQLTKSEKARKRALKRNRDEHGHFVK